MDQTPPPEPTTIITESDLRQLQDELENAYNRLDELEQHIHPWHAQGIESIRSAHQIIKDYIATLDEPTDWRTNTAPGDVAARDSL